MDTYPTVFFTSDSDWNPKISDNEWTDQDLAAATSGFSDERLFGGRINDFGELTSLSDHETEWDRDLYVDSCIQDRIADESRERQAVLDGYVHYIYVDRCLNEVKTQNLFTLRVNKQQVTRSVTDFEKL
jgi:hypothetical protein